MEDPTTIALNLTFFGTLGVAFVMFLGLFAVFVATLVIAGIGRLAAVTVVAIAGGVARVAGTVTAAARPATPAPSTSPAAPSDAADNAFPSTAPRPSKRPTPVKPSRKETPQLSADWAAAVDRADARAAARAKAEAAPAVTVSVRDLPIPTAPVQETLKVAPLVESATDQKTAGRSGPAGVSQP
ncbi:putative lipid-binding transport protein (Tim44 family) [Arthrobacter sp. V4I6]|uniref:hypothetical protein n=1 Tax=unclassified Arthrobacter TaxID=235627 RepID=UPI0027810719|nr:MULTISPECIES: hypothetical protein [unclassified Arthrobacter]MDQ0823594.1 putative lipid-binding transport protein (Tim44 family) [Arthrobacter sp. V1I7]MDQ0853229.1 putative lipid-binding transport protein (Tim44 family) [Arthrobacter sp. V4I6]